MKHVHLPFSVFLVLVQFSVDGVVKFVLQGGQIVAEILEAVVELLNGVAGVGHIQGQILFNCLSRFD